MPPPLLAATSRVETGGGGEDGGCDLGCDSGVEAAKVEIAPLTVGMWNQDGAGGKNDADVNFDGAADDVATARGAEEAREVQRRRTRCRGSQVCREV